ncbi:hypothetical protein ABZ807_31650 [Micromonospora sp. NPDC047548]|uniref:hypothetical protein n=1 Tax=Micromonospora sp. NPDC047548 TaxID=3155624 RepID=UPI003410BCF2
MIDWRSVQDVQGDSGVVIGRLLDRLGRQPDAAVWDEVERRLVVEAECCCSAGFATLPQLSRLAQSGADEFWERALQLGAVIVRTLHRYHRHDDLVRTNPEALAALHSLARTRLATCTGPALVQQLQDALTFAGYTFWASISLDFTDEHYHLNCPHCTTRLAIVIDDYGHYSAIRDHNDGDISRLPLDPIIAQDLTGIGRWMHDTAVAGGDTTLVDGLTYLFGRASCGMCGTAPPRRGNRTAPPSPARPTSDVAAATTTR